MEFLHGVPPQVLYNRMFVQGYRERIILQVMDRVAISGKMTSDEMTTALYLHAKMKE